MLDTKTDDMADEGPPRYIEASGTQTAREGGGATVQSGDMVVLFGEDGRRIPARAGEGRKGTHFGEVDMAAVVGAPYGSAVKTHLGRPVYVLPMTLQDHIQALKRRTQIIYPKDLGTILVKLGVRTGARVLECGTGSGSLTTALAWMVGPSGRVYSYEREPAFSERAAYNLRRSRLIDRVEFKIRDVAEGGVDEQHLDAVFLDVREPPLVLDAVTGALAPGGMLGILVPTTNQVSQVLTALGRAPYVDIEVLETFERRYKVNADRLRPQDRMIGHTGYLMFARRVVPDETFRPVLRHRANQVAKALARLRKRQAAAPVPDGEDRGDGADLVGQ